MDNDEKKLLDWLESMEGQKGHLGYAVKEIRRLKKRIAEVNNLRAALEDDNIRCLVQFERRTRIRTKEPVPVFYLDPVWDGMIAAVADATGINVDEICGRSHKGTFVKVRQAISNVWIFATGESIKKTGKRLGNRDHSTILNLMRRRAEIMSSRSSDTVLEDCAETAAREYMSSNETIKALRAHYEMLKARKDGLIVPMT